MRAQRELSQRALRRLTVFAVGSCACVGAHAGTVSFAAEQPFATSQAPYSVTTADINADGKLDVITANFNITSQGTAVLLNTTATNASTPSFAAWQGFATLSNSSWVTTADINSDGKPDLVVADDGAGDVSVLLNTTAAGAGTPSFAPQQFFAAGPAGTEKTLVVATADINGDSKPDMITADFAIGKISVFINTTPALATTPTFAAHVDFLSGSGTANTKPRFVTIADINGDGKPDVIVANGGDNTISVFLNITATNAATPNFAGQQIFATGSNPTGVAADDLNGDGKPDLIVANEMDNTIWARFNTTLNGAGTVNLSAPASVPSGFNAQSVYGITTADIDGDGKPDVIVADRTDSLVSVLVNTSPANASVPSFAAQQTFTTGTFPLSVTAADVNGDGSPDLVVANTTGNTVSVLLNTTSPDQIFADNFE
jgi:hypothetical protein